VNVRGGAALAVVLLVVVIRVAGFAPAGTAAALEAASSAATIAGLGADSGGRGDLVVSAPAAVLYRAFGVSDWATAAWPLLLSTVALLALAAAAGRHGGTEAAWWAALVFAVWPPAAARASALEPAGIYASALVIAGAGLAWPGVRRLASVVILAGVAAAGWRSAGPALWAVVLGAPLAFAAGVWAARDRVLSQDVRGRAAICLAAVIAAGLVGPAGSTPRFAALVPFGYAAAAAAVVLAAGSLVRPHLRAASAAAALCALVIGGASAVHLQAAESRASVGAARSVMGTWQAEGSGCPIHAVDRPTADLVRYAAAFRVSAPGVSAERFAEQWRQSGRSVAGCLAVPVGTRLPETSFGASLMARTSTLEMWRLADSREDIRQLAVALAGIGEAPTVTALGGVIKAADAAGDPCVAFEAAEALESNGAPRPEADLLSWATACVASRPPQAAENLLAPDAWSRDPSWRLQAAEMRPEGGPWRFEFADGDDWRAMVQGSALQARGIYVAEATLSGTARADLVAIELSDGRNLAAARDHQLGEPVTFRIAFRAPDGGGRAAVFPVLFRGAGEARIHDVILVRVHQPVHAIP
jgi:hypothetical protein